MPELPEVETTRRGIEPHLKGATIDQVVVRQAKLRWPIPRGLDQKLAGESVVTVGRRAKYLLLQTAPGTLILHLGMSGSLRITASDTPAGKHDHFDIRFGDQLLRLNDPRRFGAVLWCRGDPAKHKLLATLGPEPLDERFDGDHLHTLSRGRRVAVKQFIMDGKVVVGVGNIYASESLFRARIHPRTAAGKISRTRYLALTETIKEVLSEAITQGGTTLRDFTGSDGKPGYFTQQLNVYGRTGEPCPLCATPIKQLTLGQRSTFYCPSCQH
ncbi:DNA-formamidopyrimidine glycosylase [Solemya pervernicosa gill symbiont]|uniref:Formamidopyrimidine-DNA glycosylase n=2 Tax=Gammaproteobacteria incertae sedis TaxID=118884 RepID=A0A1T2LBD9_9GAMM|nr:bifunctional DNA-formamidopyrimidine glycosylase/DNA-(apurinic or apyrimidinic site) lyase [Candidatus Reidiella endopervernicosa]OOZ42344.1 DNA-formamidopyrimidine glycosylase [Solemya pervernicosa gill symbiont]QKQ25732.1 bifunctional DNA-formamidopyrimidine glycosylase/DNA-(apurinic or apyrimidinic site) lyase [Candidatus Reidiella endopervernicosa]